MLDCMPVAVKYTSLLYHKRFHFFVVPMATHAEPKHRHRHISLAPLSPSPSPERATGCSHGRKDIGGDALSPGLDAFPTLLAPCVVAHALGDDCGGGWVARIGYPSSPWVDPASPLSDLDNGGSWRRGRGWFRSRLDGTPATRWVSMGNLWWQATATSLPWLCVWTTTASATAAS